jgi:hypothetical protein
MRRILSAEQPYVNKIPIEFIGIEQILLFSGEKGSPWPATPLSWRPSLLGSATVAHSVKKNANDPLMPK